MANVRLIDANVVLARLKTDIVLGETEKAFLRNYVNNAPTVDAVPVVRCKDCKHCTVTCDGRVCEHALPTKQMMDYYIYGSTILARVEADDFCSHGERRTDV